MILVNKKGRLGNNLFQYFFAKIIAKELGIDFKTNFTLPIEFGLDNFDNHNQNINVENVLNENWNGPVCELFFNNKKIDQDIDKILKSLKENDIKSILLDGYFQQKNYYTPYIDIIKSSFNFKRDYKKNTLGIHLRKDDITNSINDLPDYWFIEMVKKFPEHKKYVTTDSPNNPVVKQLLDLGCELYINSPQNTIIEFSQFSDLILSQGTFSWWMGFLSEGTKYMMIPKSGWNSMNNGVDTLLNYDSWIYYDTELKKMNLC